MISCSYDKTMKIWNSIYPYNLIKILEGHNRNVSSMLKLKENKNFVSGSHDFTLRAWNIFSYQCQTVIENVQCCTGKSLEEIDKNRVVTGGKNKIIIIILLAIKLNILLVIRITLIRYWY